MANTTENEPKVEMTVQTENTPATSDNTDLDTCLGGVQIAINELRRLREEKKRMEYEMARLQTINTINKDLLAILRKKLFWQNNMELVQLIDDTVRG